MASNSLPKMDVYSLQKLQSEAQFDELVAEDNTEAYELYEEWRGFQWILHRPSQRNGFWSYAVPGKTLAVDDCVVNIKWADGPEEQLAIRNRKYYFSSQPDKPFMHEGFVGQIRPES